MEDFALKKMVRNLKQLDFHLYEDATLQGRLVYCKSVQTANMMFLIAKFKQKVM